MPGELADRFKSPSQRARVVTEAWGARELFCPNCPSDALAPLPNNAKAADFRCPRCEVRTQLKGKAGAFGNRVSDGEYGTFLGALRAGRTPDLVLLEYRRDPWTVRGVLLIPRFALPESAVLARRPLRATARRAGWQGCNLALGNVPPSARIPLVRGGQSRPPEDVRAEYARLRPLLTQTAPDTRGWTLDVLRIVQNLGRREFTNADVYAHADELARVHPGNRHVTDKIRQQLQVLRDLGFFRHRAAGRWELLA